MKITLNSINNILDEIQYYEHIGYYKTADKLTKVLKKFAWNFDIKDINDGKLPYLNNIENIAEITRLMDILKQTPDCLSLLQDFHNKQPMTWQDPRDCRLKLTQQWQQENPNKQIPPEIIQQITEQCTSNINNMMNSPYFTDDQNYMKCMDALGNIGYKDDIEQLFPNIKQKEKQQTPTALTTPVV